MPKGHGVPQHHALLQDCIAVLIATGLEGPTKRQRANIVNAIGLVTANLFSAGVEQSTLQQDMMTAGLVEYDSTSRTWFGCAWWDIITATCVGKYWRATRCCVQLGKAARSKLRLSLHAHTASPHPHASHAWRSSSGSAGLPAAHASHAWLSSGGSAGLSVELLPLQYKLGDYHNSCRTEQTICKEWSDLDSKRDRPSTRMAAGSGSSRCMHAVYFCTSSRLLTYLATQERAVQEEVEVIQTMHCTHPQQAGVHAG